MRRLLPTFRILSTTLLLLGLLPLTGCSTNPATGKLQFNVISEAKEIALGVEAQGGFLDQNGGTVRSTRTVNYVNQLGHRLAAVSERPELPWEFHVLDSAQINAFALPGGQGVCFAGVDVADDHRSAAGRRVGARDRPRDGAARQHADVAVDRPAGGVGGGGRGGGDQQ